MNGKFRFIVWLVLFVSVVAVLVIGLFTGGCTRAVYMEPAAAFEFNRFNASVQSWDDKCREDPNTCAEALSTMAKELQTWTALVNGMDPNEN